MGILSLLSILSEKHMITLNTGNEFSHKIGNDSTMRGSREGLVIVVLFQSLGLGNFQKEDMPSFSPDSKSPSLIRAFQ